MHSPEHVFGELFEAVQMQGVFPDSKTFVDMIPKISVEEVLIQYRRQKDLKDFNLKIFVDRHFSLPTTGILPELAAFNSLEERLHQQWKVLTKDADEEKEGSSLIPLPYAYVVPGGRFGEIYYWDSYFTMLGLKGSGRVDLIEAMVKNFAHLIDVVGHIPNGNRSYFISRSQPPFFVKMVELLAEVTQDESILIQYLPQLEREYAFWMDGSVDLIVGKANARVVRLDEATILNRYWDDLDTPRAESYREDVELLHLSKGDQSRMRHIRAACESGWDFSSRWLMDEQDLNTIEAAHIIPIDLNVLLFELERVLHYVYSLKEDMAHAIHYQDLMGKRLNGIERYLWSSEGELYLDYHFVQQKSMQRPSLATLFPLWSGFASENQAKSVLNYIEKQLLKPGGLVTSNSYSGQQWDAPNGWAPLQWIGLVACANYGYQDLAVDIAARWTALNENVFARTGKMMEKYNVEDLSLEAGGGEYPVQDGFGWSNGIYLAMKEFLRT
ncbi:alpha,alpha-trehalase TreF [Mongoliitalea daihaiensis]|uniref:alpha,alpha-trehalase TreF n=1 Tax=Mongoliitalea daihaiensis TaxID=2782006 RepID=UPI001F25420E|nr:alpha,alpha-trehalase TreF [Mongoliitalea daihaiensis]UJP65571.1 alpha,alpha-trehalase TreF [Mongoliitalea daihaiensis]